MTRVGEKEAGHDARPLLSASVMRVGVPTILVTGPVRVGKTTLIDEMSALLRAAKIPHAAVDFDQLTASYPRPPSDDVWGTQLGLANLSALWRSYSELGADRLLIARVIENRKELDGYRAAVPGADIVVVRLRAEVSTLRERVRGRGSGSGHAVAPRPHRRAGGLHGHVEDLLVETDGRHQTDLAGDVLARVGWLAAT